jgi:hypothetical protein
MKKMLTTIIVAVLVLSFGLLPDPALAATSGQSSGSITVAQVAPTFTYTAPNTSTVLEVYSDAGLTTVATSLTPQVEYWVKLTVGDANTLADLSTVKVILKYFAGGSTGSTDINTDTGSNQTEAVLTCSNAGGTPSWAIDGGTNGTWAIVNSDCVQPAISASSGSYVFAFKPGKVATQSTGGGQANAGFAVFAWAINSGSGAAYVWYQDGSSNVKKGLNWYGETQVNTSSVTWTGIAPGTDFNGTDSKQTGISVKYIANGGYHNTVGASTTWTGGLGATLDETGACSSARYFALKAWNDDTPANAVLVTAAGTSVQSGQTQTAEAGSTITTNTLYLKLASVFPVATYNGTITYTIANP